MLLDHGLLSKALELGAFSTMPKLMGEKPDKTREEKAADKKEEAAQAADELEKADADAESEERFIERVEAFVREALAEAEGQGSSSRDAYKDDLVYNERKKVIAEFSKRGYKKCHSCKASVESLSSPPPPTRN
jgi:DNA-directed RNA polymerase I subunit RPA1